MFLLLPQGPDWPLFCVEILLTLRPDLILLCHLVQKL
jgi:hypothetical protein